jgi:predicted DNA binding CopG/RHH family protein
MGRVVFVQNWLIFAFFACLGALGALLLAFLAWRVWGGIKGIKSLAETTLLRITALEMAIDAPCKLTPRLAALESWVKDFEEEEKAAAKEEAEAKTEKFRNLAQLSNQAQAERKAQEAAAYQETMAAVKAGGHDIEAIKASVSAVVQKYPQVAENAVKKAVRDLGFQKYEGVIMPMVAELAGRFLAPKPQAQQEEVMTPSW